MNADPRWSLAHRLSIWLAAQTVLALTAVSCAIYWAMALELRTRQNESLQQMQSVVLHLLDTTQGPGDLPALLHSLDDFLAGQPDLRLDLRDESGSELFGNRKGKTAAKREMSIHFSSDAIPAGVGRVNATLTLNTDEDQALLRRLAISLAAVALACAFAASTGAFVLVRRGLAPVHDLADQAGSIGVETFAHRLNGSAQPTELQPLVAQFNALLARLERAYGQLEGFNADVAHELNTPLSTLITSTELALRKRRDSESLTETLESNLEELHRLSGIIKDMLFLANAEHGARARSETIPSVARVVREVVEFYDAAYAGAGLCINVDGDARCELDVPLFKRALSNLLSNANRYADRGTVVQVRISEDSPESIRVAVSNSGPGIDSSHAPRLFDRFYRGDPARSESASHHGLGLSIVSAIARMHGGSTFVESTDRGTTIGMLLPRPSTRDSSPRR